MIDWASPPPGDILGLFPSRCASAYYRVVVPLSTRCDASWATFDDVTREQLEAARTVVAWGVVGPPEDVQAFFRSLRRAWGVQRILIDFDDALFASHSIPDVMPPPLALEGARLALRLADGVIVQNEALARHYRPWTDAPIWVIPNVLRPRDFPPPQECAKRAGVVVVMAGTPSHGVDWEVAVPGVRRILERRTDVRLRLIGCEPIGLRGVRGERLPATSFDRYFSLLRGGDIGLAPLPDSEFNRGKSPVKAYEYAASGMAVVAGATQYAEACGDDAVIIPDDAPPTAWEEAIETLANDAALRWSLMERLRRRALSLYVQTEYRAAVSRAMKGEDAWR